MSPDHPFARTTCACPDCVQCCHDQPGSCAPGDVEAIAAHLQLPVREALRFFWASPGALIGNRATGTTARVGTITPRLRAGRCVFLDAHDRCTVHAVAPFGCAYFDTHQDAAAGQARGVYLVRLQLSAAYQSLRRTLAPATHYRPREAAH